MTDNYCGCNEPTTKYYVKINQQGPRGIPGQTGAKGETGAKGFSPQIQVVEDNVDHYVLRFIDEDNVYLSPNLLKGALAYTKEESNARYYTKTYIDTTLANYDTITDVNSKLATKLDKTTYNTDKPTFALKTELPSMASTTALGLIKVGDTLTITTDGVLNIGSISYNDLTDKPTIPDAYTLPAATATTLGGIKVGNNLTISEDGTLNATGGTGGDTPIATTTTVGTVKPDGTTIAITTDGTISAVSTAAVTDRYGIQGDYSTHYGILDCPNGLIEYNVTGYNITVKNGIILQAAGNATRTTIASDITYTIQEHNQELVLFYAGGEILEAGDVFYQVDEPENGTVGYTAWFNPVLGKWKFKSTDAGNVWREAVATPIANVKTGAEGILTLNYIGYRILDDDIIPHINDTTASNSNVYSSNKVDTLINNLDEIKNNKIFDINKYTLVGSPTITNEGIASGFSTNDYITCTLTVDFTKPFKISGKFNSGDVTKDQSIFATPISDAFFQIGVHSDGYPVVYFPPQSGETLNWKKTQYQISANTDYYFELKYDGANLNLSVGANKNTLNNSTGNITTVDFTSSSATSLKYIGRNVSGTHICNGSIDLNALKIYVDGIEIFNSFMESTVPIFNKTNTIATQLGTLEVETDNNFSAVNSALNGKANLSDLANYVPLNTYNELLARVTELETLINGGTANA